MIFYKLWIIWISLQCIYTESRKKDLQDHSSFADVVHGQENPGSIDGSELTEGQKEAILQLHNAFRSMVKPPASNMLKMVWDYDLEKIASDFSSKCIVAHNPDRHRLAKNYDWVGENIAWGTGSCGDKDCGDVYEGVKRWFSESNSYNYVTGQCSGKCTLYTQMVWWESNKLGCGAKKCGDRTILVCNYAPGGNYVGQRPYKSGNPCSDCPSGMSCEDNLCMDKTENVRPGSKKDGSDLGGDMMKAAKQATFTTPLPTSYPFHSPSVLPVITPPSEVGSTTAAKLSNDYDGGQLNDNTNQHTVNSGNNENTKSAPHTLPAGWNELPVQLTQVDSGMTSAIWGMNASHSLFIVEDFIKLIPVDGTMHHISVGQAGVWAVGLLGNVFYRKGLTIENPKGLFWEKIHGNLKQIDSGPPGIVWGVNRYDGIFCRIGIRMDKPTGTGWMRIEGNMKYVSCGEFGCWAVDNRGDIYYRSGITESKPEGQQWKLVPGRLRMIESGPLGLTVGLDLNSNLMIRNGVSQEKGEGISWEKTELVLAHVTVGESGIIGILPDGTLAIRQDLRKYIAQQSAVAPTDTAPPTKDFPLDAFTTPTVPTIPILKSGAEGFHRSASLESPTVRVEKEHNNNNALMLQDYNNLNGPPLKSPEEPEKLHLTPEMASKILKLIEAKGNELETDHHKAAAENIARNLTVVEGSSQAGNTPAKTETSVSKDEINNNKSSSEQKEETTKPTEKVKETETEKVKETETKATSKNESTPQPKPPDKVEEHSPTENAQSTVENKEKGQQSPEKDKTASQQEKMEKAGENHEVTHHVETPEVHEAHPSPTTQKTKSTVPPTHKRRTTHPTHKTTEPRHPKHHPTPSQPESTDSMLKITHPHMHHVHTVSHEKEDVQYPQPKIWHHPATTHAHLEQKHVQPHTPHTHVPHTLPHTLPHTVPQTHPPTVVQPVVTTKFNPLKTQTHRIWVHSLATSAPKPTAHLVHEAPIVEHTLGPVTTHRQTPGFERPRVKVMKDLASAHMQHQLPIKPKPASPKLSWNLARSCCTIPDSVCPIPNDCISYIECEGYSGKRKACDRGKEFNPVTNICDYPRNVECGDTRKAVPPQVHHVTPEQAVPVSQNYLHVTPPKDVAAKDVSKAGQPRINQPHQDFDGVLREVWFGLGLSPLLTMLTNNPRFPTHPDEYIVLDKFEAPPNAGDGYGQRLSTYYKAPQTGEYIFYMSCDNECELWVSPDAEEIHSNLILELKHGHFTSFRQWHKYPEEQTSRPIYLQEGSFYFMESFMKEGTGGDDLSVGVKLPNGEFDLPISSNLHLIPGDTIDITTISGRKPGQPVQASMAQDPAKAFHPPIIPNMITGFHPEAMGPQTGQTVEQWLSANHGAPVMNGAMAMHNNKNGAAIPGAEMYSSYPAPDDMEAFEQQHLTLKKRSQIPHPNNVTAVR